MRVQFDGAVPHSITPTVLRFLITCGEVRARRSTCPFCPPSFLTKGSKKHLGAREALEHGLLGPLSSELRSEVTSEATGSLRGHF